MKVVIAVSGGCITSVHSDNINLEVELYDFDDVDHDVLAAMEMESNWEDATRYLHELNVL